MTGTPHANATPIRAEAVIIGAVVALVLAGVVWVLSQRQQELRSSPAGFDGLQAWLAAGGGSAQAFSGGWMLDPAAIGLLVLPLYDSAPSQTRSAPKDTVELLFQQDENDIDWSTLRQKITRVPAMVVLPKWRSGMRLTGIAHPALLVDPAPVDAFLGTLTGASATRLTRIPRVFTTLPYAAETGETLSATLYAAQLFDGTACDPIIGAGRQTLLGLCPLAGTDRSVFVLSDPDLLNNHGLRLGQNAAIARDMLLAAAGDGSVMIDYSRDNWLAEADAPLRRERTWADLLRFFQPPFLTMWLGAAATLGLALWRSFRRAGPVAAAAQAASGKAQAIAARARLMRLTGQDGAMLADYAAARIGATAARLVGPGHARRIGEPQAFLRHVARHRPELAERLGAVLAGLQALPVHVSPAVAIRHVEDLEQTLELIAHDA